MGLRRVACAIINRTRISELTPFGRLELPVAGAGDGRTTLLPRALVLIAAVGIPVAVPLAAMFIPSVGIPVLVPLAVLAIPAVGIAPGLLPLTVLGIPTMCIAPRLHALMRLAENIATRRLDLTRLVENIAPGLGRGESLTIRLRGKRTIRSGLGA